MKDKIKKIEELAEIVKSMQAKGMKTAATSGCFDIIHPGHVEYLEEASREADCLIVLLNSDDSVKKLKGNKRPIVNEVDRALVIAALDAVNYVCLFDELTPCTVLEKIKPDFFIKGGDYRGQKIPEEEILQEYGGIVKYVTLVDGKSTTDIISRIIEIHKEENI